MLHPLAHRPRAISLLLRRLRRLREIHHARRIRWQRVEWGPAAFRADWVEHGLAIRAHVSPEAGDPCDRPRVTVHVEVRKGTQRLGSVSQQHVLADAGGVHHARVARALAHRLVHGSERLQAHLA